MVVAAQYRDFPAEVADGPAEALIDAILEAEKGIVHWIPAGPVPPLLVSVRPRATVPPGTVDPLERVSEPD